MEEKEFQKLYSKVIAKGWSDPQFKADLLKNPEAVLSAEGIVFPKGTKITINENTENHLYLVFPEKPVGNLTEDQLGAIAAGFNCVCGIQC